MTDSVSAIVREAETNYTSGSTNLGEHVSWSMYDTVERINAYLNSKHTSGSEDSLDREKPFFNIVTAAVNIWYRATDVDRKDIIIRPDNIKNTVPALLATIKLQEWMRKARFGVFLNQWGRTLSQYGSAVVKFVEKDGELIASVIPWNRMIVDPVNFDALPRIEKFYLTPSQLRKNPLYDQEAVENLLESRSTRKTTRGQQIDNKDEFVELYEVHGELPLSLLTGKDTDDEKYRQQMHVISFVGKKVGRQAQFEDFTLYKGKESKDPYMITHLIEEDGRTLSIGAVEYLFDAQWMQNHTMKNMKDTLDLSSKLVFQTADGNYVGRNVLTAIETGDILVHAENRPLTKINNDKSDITALQNFSTQWKALAQELTSTPDAIRGNTLPSGTPYALGGLLAQNANSLFEIMTESKGLAIEDMCRTHIIPHLKKKLNNKDEMLATLDDNNLKKIDSIFVPKEAIRRHNEKFKKDMKAALLDDNAPLPTSFNKEVGEQEVREDLAPLANIRSVNPEDIDWKEAFKDLEWEVEVAVTNESKDKQAVLTTLSSTLQTIAGVAARGVPMSADERLVFNKIMQETGTVSPVELSATAAAPPVALPEKQPVNA